MRSAMAGRWLLGSLRGGLVAAAVAGACVLGCLAVMPAAARAARPSFTQVPGSPFATGSVPESVVFSPSGGLLTTGNFGDGTVSVFSVASEGTLTPVSGSPFATGSGPHSMAYSPSGGLLATANKLDGTVSVFSVAADGTLTQVPGSPFATGSTPESVAFSPSGGLLTTANNDYSTGDGTLSVFSVAADGTLTQVPGSPFATGSDPGSVVFSPSGGLLVTANQVDSTVSVFSVTADGTLTQVPGSPFATGFYPGSMAFSPSGGLLATANQLNGSVSVFSVAADGTLTQVPGSPFATGFNPGPSIAFSPSGGQLAITNDDYSDDDGTVSVFSVAADGRLTPGAVLPTGQMPVSVAFSPSGGLLATANNDYSNLNDTVSVYTATKGADLGVSFPASDPTTATAGSAFAETVTVTNHGPHATASGSGMALSLPPMRFGVSAIGLDGGQREGHQVSWKIPALAPGASVSHTVTFQAAAQASGHIKLTGLTELQSTDPDPANNRATLTISLTPAGS